MCTVHIWKVTCLLAAAVSINPLVCIPNIILHAFAAMSSITLYWQYHKTPEPARGFACDAIFPQTGILPRREGGDKKVEISLPAIGITPLIIILIDPNRRAISGKRSNGVPVNSRRYALIAGAPTRGFAFQSPNPITSPNHQPPPLPLLSQPSSEFIIH